jgi:hypothetical protein
LTFVGCGSTAAAGVSSKTHPAQPPMADMIAHRVRRYSGPGHVVAQNSIPLLDSAPTNCGPDLHGSLLLTLILPTPATLRSRQSLADQRAAHVAAAHGQMCKRAPVAVDLATLDDADLARREKFLSATQPPVCRAPIQHRIALERFRARRNPRADISRHRVRGSCRRRSPHRRRRLGRPAVVWSG